MATSSSTEPKRNEQDAAMQMQHESMHTPHAANEQCSIADWLVVVERDLQTALDQSQACSHQCLKALESLAQLRAIVVSRPGSVPAAIKPGSLRMLPELRRADTCVDHVEQRASLTQTVIGTPQHQLTSREAEVLVQIAGGRSNKQIALLLCLSVRTVERHINNIYRKIDAQNKADATAWALRHDLA